MFIKGVVVGAVVPAVFGLMFQAQRLVSSPAERQPAGRYVIAQPPPAGDSSYGNFMWVLDSATGTMRGYRFAKITDEKTKDVVTWVTEELPTDIEYARSRR